MPASKLLSFLLQNLGQHRLERGASIAGVCIKDIYVNKFGYGQNKDININEKFVPHTFPTFPRSILCIQFPGDKVNISTILVTIFTKVINRGHVSLQREEIASNHR